ncbi:MAG: hypothetical protein MJE68_14215 [Proteobacteria bacterium]|nr:hypothetical protein [Pseudomonadota bacterium]
MTPPTIAFSLILLSAAKVDSKELERERESEREGEREGGGREKDRGRGIRCTHLLQVV